MRVADPIWFILLKERAGKLPAIEQYLDQKAIDRLYAEAVERAEKEIEQP